MKEFIKNNFWLLLGIGIAVVLIIIAVAIVVSVKKSNKKVEQISIDNQQKESVTEPEQPTQEVKEESFEVKQEEVTKKEENKQEIKTFEEKKQKRKSLLGMDSFSLRENQQYLRTRVSVLQEYRTSHQAPAESAHQSGGSYFQVSLFPPAFFLPVPSEY